MDETKTGFLKKDHRNRHFTHPDPILQESRKIQAPGPRSASFGCPGMHDVMVALHDSRSDRLPFHPYKRIKDGPCRRDSHLVMLFIDLGKPQE